MKNQFFRMYKYLSGHFWLLAVTLPLSLIIATMDSLSVWILSTIPAILFAKQEVVSTVAPTFSISSINEYLKFQTNHILNNFDGVSPLSVLCVLIVIIYTIKNFLSVLNSNLNIIVYTGVIRTMRTDFLKHILQLQVKYFDKSESGHITTLILSDLERIKAAIITSLQQLFTEPVRLAISFTLLISINWKLLLAISVVYPIIGYLIYIFGKTSKRRTIREQSSFGNLISRINEIIHGVRTVKIFGAIQFEEQNFTRLNNAYTTSARRNERIKTFLSPITELLSIYTTALLLLFGGTMIVTSGNFSADDFTRFLIILALSYQPLKNIGGMNNTLQAGIASADRVFALIDSDQEILDFEKEDLLFTSKIEFCNVNFKYPDTQNPVLTDVSFSVEKGQVVALVGSSGAGKSTILDLIPRFYDITSGHITIDDIDIRDVKLTQLRNTLSVVSQDNFLFNGSIRENIIYSNDPDEDKLLTAAKAANALEFIEKLPAGFETIIGERGILLSGGQKQRIAIARALYRNTPILILDEATSALDTESERLVQDAIDHAMTGRTVLVVAHRLSTVKHADKIFVIEAGRIVESGNHEELIQTNGRYKSLCDLQFK